MKQLFDVFFPFPNGIPVGILHSQTAALMTGFMKCKAVVKPLGIACMRNVWPSFLHRKLYGLQTQMPLLDIPAIRRKSGIISLWLGISTYS